MSKRNLQKEDKEQFNGSLQKWKFHFFVFAFSFLIYANTIPNKYNMDDELVTSVSPSMQHSRTSKGFKAILQIFKEPYYQDEQGYAFEYRPIVLTTFAVEHALWGANPHVSHLVNVLLYALLCVLLLTTLNLQFKEYNPLLALLAALIFSAHPIHTEVVASIKNRDEILALIGAMGSLFFFLRYAEQKKIWFFLAAVVCFAGGMLSKQSIIVFMVILPTLIILFTRLSGKHIALITAILCAIAYPLIQLVRINRIEIIAGAVLFTTAIYQIRHPELILGFINRIWKVISAGKNKVTDVFKQVNAGSFHFGNIPTAIIFVILMVVAAGTFFFSRAFFLIPLMGFFPLSAFAPQKAKKYFLWLCLGIAFYGILAVKIHSTDELFRNIYELFVLFFAYHIILGGKREKIHYLIPAMLFYAGGIFVFGMDNFNPSLIIIGAIGVTFTPYFGWYKWFILVLFIFASIFNQSWSLGSVIGFFATGVASLLIFFAPKKNNQIIAFISLSLLTAAILNSLFQPVRTPELVPAALRNSKPATGYLNPENVTANRLMDYVENVTATSASVREKVGTGMVIIGKYLGLALVPYPMSFYYGYRIIDKTDMFKPLPLLIGLITAAALFLSLFCIRRNSPLAASILIFIVGLLAVANIIKPIPGMMGDRFLFVPTVGFAIMVALLFIKTARIHIEKTENSALVMPGYVKIALSIILLLYSGITIVRNAQWKDALTLMRHDIQHLSESAQAQNLLATHLVRKALEKGNQSADNNKLLEEAEMHYEKAVAVYPEFFNANYDLGRVRMMMGKLSEAEGPFLRVIEIDSTFSEPYFHLGIIKTNKGDFSGAIPYYKNYLKSAPGNLDALMNLSYCYAQLNDFSQALALTKRAVSLYPRQPEPYINMCRIFSYLQMPDSARFYLQRAESLAPSHPDVVKLKNSLSQTAPP